MPLKNEEMDVRFTYHPPKESQLETFQNIRRKARQFAQMVNSFCPDSRESSLALTKIEEAVMWANAALVRRGE